MNTTKKNYLPQTIYFAMLLFCIAALVVTDIKHGNEINTSNTSSELSSDWITSDGDEINLSDLSTLGDGYNTISHKMPDTIEAGSSLNFNTHNVRFEVYTADPDTASDTAPIYSFGPSDNLSGEGIGDAYHFVPLDQSLAGGSLYLSVDPVYRSSSSFKNVYIEGQSTYFYRVLKAKGFSFLLSMIVVFMGINFLFLRLGFPSKEMDYSLMGLGFGAIVLGLWSGIETTVPSLLFGRHLALIRVGDYLLPALSELPFIVFINSMTIRRRRIYEYLSAITSGTALLLTMIYRIAFDADLHDLMFLPLTFYFQILLSAAILIDNIIVSRREKTRQNIGFFYAGTLVFLLADLCDVVIYRGSGKKNMDNGFLLRTGMVIFMFLLLIQILKTMSSVRKDTTMNHFVNDLLHYSMMAESSKGALEQMLEFLGRECKAERVYIFENTSEKCFENTYFWSKNGKEIDQKLKGKLRSDEIVSNWLSNFKLYGNVIMEDRDEYKEKSLQMSDMAKELSIETHVAAPLMIDNEYIGFFGIDNLSKEIVPQVAYSIDLIGFFMSVMLRQRNNEHMLRRYSYRDQMTGAMNRRALSKLANEDLVPGEDIGLLSCDINGLKQANDTLGHEAGDSMIMDVANALMSVFGSKRVFRMGGDEFLAISNANEDKFSEDTERLKSVLASKGRSASIGIAWGSYNPDSFDALQKEADSAMYMDKRSYYKSFPGKSRRSGDSLLRSG